jgi:hypothetical protein
MQLTHNAVGISDSGNSNNATAAAKAISTVRVRYITCTAQHTSKQRTAALYIPLPTYAFPHPSQVPRLCGP